MKPTVVKKPKRHVVTRAMLREHERWARDEVYDRRAEAELWRAAVGFARRKLVLAERMLRDARARRRALRRSLDTRKD